MKNHSPKNLHFVCIAYALFCSFLSNHLLKLIVLISIASFASCNKVDVVAPVNSSTENQGFKSLMVNDAFNWADSRSVTIDVVPLQTESNLLNTLYVKTEGNQTLLTYHTTMHQALQLKIDLPIEQNKVKIVYGSIEKIIDVINNKVSFDFLTPIPPEYE